MHSLIYGFKSLYIIQNTADSILTLSEMTLYISEVGAAVLLQNMLWLHLSWLSHKLSIVLFNTSSPEDINTALHVPSVIYVYSIAKEYVPLPLK